MGVLEKLSHLVVGERASASRRAGAALQECYCDCVRRAGRLAQHAELAPQAFSLESLKDLAAAEEKQAQRLRDALRAANEQVPAVPNEPSPAGALSHWGRLVQDLEAHRASVQRLRELTMHFAEELPNTAQLFDELCREESVHCEYLRNLIARADPQALD
jgi:hypothetical protein